MAVLVYALSPCAAAMDDVFQCEAAQQRVMLLAPGVAAVARGPRRAATVGHTASDPQLGQ